MASLQGRGVARAVRVAHAIAAKAAKMDAGLMAAAVGVIGQHKAGLDDLADDEYMMPAHRDTPRRRLGLREAQPVRRKPKLTDAAPEYLDGRATAAERPRRTTGRMRQD